jgi:diguanylate cyclase (GGDEF)-like protein/PAS domain S-box-containing protein
LSVALTCPLQAGLPPLTEEVASMSHVPGIAQFLESGLVPELIELCPDGIIGADRSGTVTLFNGKAAALTGRSPQTVIGRLHVGELYGGLEQARAIKAAIYTEDQGGKDRLEGFATELVDTSGRRIPIRLSAVLLKKNGTEIGSVGFFHDMSQQKILEEKLRQLSITDGLTGLYNQRHFHVCIADELARAHRYQRPLSLICIDLDHFKQINDRYGHLEGDNLLRVVGVLLKEASRRSDQAFRYGGDEFFMLLPETDLTQAMATAQRVRHAFAERCTVDLVDKDWTLPRLSLSIGVVQREGEMESEALIKRADLAMFTAKQQGGNRVVAG